MQRDPLEYKDRLNIYAYVHNNPLRYIDSMGTTTMTMKEYEYSQGIQEDREFAFTISVGGYYNGEQGSGTSSSGPTARGGIEVSFHNDSYETALNGIYNNTGGGANIVVDVTTTLPDSQTSEVTTGVTLNFNPIAIPLPEGHIRVGYGETYGETEIFNFSGYLNSLFK